MQPVSPQWTMALLGGMNAAPPPCPGNSGARRGARHGEESPWRREGPAEKVHGAEKGQPPLVVCEVVHVQPPRARRRRVAAPSPPPSPVPPTDSLAPHCRRAVTVASTALARPAPRRAFASAFACSSSRPRGEGNRQSPAAPARTRKGGDAQRVSSVLPVQRRPRCPVWHTCP